jgi:hypothetical protein
MRVRNARKHEKKIQQFTKIRHIEQFEGSDNTSFFLKSDGIREEENGETKKQMDERNL